MKENWYAASFDAVDEHGNVIKDFFVDCDYFQAENDEKAIEYAKEIAKNGIDYVDVGHVNIQLVSVCKVDTENEWDEIETIY